MTKIQKDLTIASLVGLGAYLVGRIIREKDEFDENAATQKVYIYSDAANACQVINQNAIINSSYGDDLYFYSDGQYNYTITFPDKYPFTGTNKPIQLPKGQSPVAGPFEPSYSTATPIQGAYTVTNSVGNPLISPIGIIVTH